MTRLLFYLVLVLTTGMIACTPTPPVSTIHFMPAIEKTDATVVIKKYPSLSSPSARKPIQLSLLHAKKTKEGRAAVHQANQASIKKPNSSNYINAIMYFNYKPGLLYQIYCAPLHVTDIEFQQGEKITSAAGGDTSRWTISEASSGNNNESHAHLLVKPNVADIDNVIVVTTDRRVYHLLLKSSNDTYMPIIAWRYPSDGLFINHPLLPNEKKSNPHTLLNKLDFNYQIRLSQGESIPDWMPTIVFNDGKKTYIQFSSHVVSSPTLFINTDHGRNRIVNYRISGNYYIVDAVIGQAQLRMGQLHHQTVVSILYKGDI